MCTMIAHQVKLEGRGKSGPEWFEVRAANVSYDHPYDLPLEHALNIDFVNEALGPGARVAVELSVDAALLARVAGRPVRVQWMRADEHGWDPKGPPTLIDLHGGLDGDGQPRRGQEPDRGKYRADDEPTLTEENS